MTFRLLIQIMIPVVGGLGLFLLGMKQMSEGMQAVAGERLRKMINAVTDNRFIACAVGAAMTALVQSSSVTTVMVVGMVNAGIMALTQAISVIMGTNIGTTITAWIVALEIADYGLPILGVSALVYLFSKNERIQYTAMIFLGLGMIFFGLELMKDGLKPLRTLDEFSALMTTFKPDSIWGVIKCVFAGSFLTAMIQSSSATVALTITLAATGSIHFETAAALVLGENIGTTITAFLSSLGTNTSGKRAAYAHILFNVIGVAIMIPVFPYYVWILGELFSENLPIASRIAFSHSFFNISIVAILLPLLKPFTAIVERLVPAKKLQEKTQLTYLDIRLYDTPALALEQSYREIMHMGEGIQIMMARLRRSLEAPCADKLLENKLFHREKRFDVIQKEIVEFIGKMMSGTLSHQITAESRIQLRIADEYETISDYIVTILKLRCKMRNHELKFAKKGVQDVFTLHDAVHVYLAFILENLKRKNGDNLSEMMAQGEQITHLVKDMRNDHLTRVSKKETSPLASLIFMDMINAYRRIKDHGFNIAEALSGEK